MIYELHTIYTYYTWHSSKVKGQTCHLFLCVPAQNFLDMEKLAAVGGQVLADLDVELFQLHLVLVVRRVP